MILFGRAIASLALCSTTLLSSVIGRSEVTEFSIKFIEELEKNSTSTYNRGRFGHANWFDSQGSLIVSGGDYIIENPSNTTNMVFQKSSISYNFSEPINTSSDGVSISSSGLNFAFAATAYSVESKSIYLFGGITQDCSASPGYSLSTDLKNLNWSALDGFSYLNNTYTPQRRNAQAVAITHPTTGTDVVYVFGGISDNQTCSGENSSGYFGIDSWDIHARTVESFEWDLALENNATIEQVVPVVDFTATALGDGVIGILGGQLSGGTVRKLDSVLVFQPEDKTWSEEFVTGDSPTARFGHVALPIPTQILPERTYGIYIHGGYAADKTTLFNDSWMLLFHNGYWTWHQLELDECSDLLSIEAGYHGAALIPGHVWRMSNESTQANDGFSLVLTFGIGNRGAVQDGVYIVDVHAQVSPGEDGKIVVKDATSFYSKDWEYPDEEEEEPKDGSLIEANQTVEERLAEPQQASALFAERAIVMQRAQSNLTEKKEIPIGAIIGPAVSGGVVLIMLVVGVLYCTLYIKNKSVDDGTSLNSEKTIIHPSSPIKSIAPIAHTLSKKASLETGNEADFFPSSAFPPTPSLHTSRSFSMSKEESNNFSTNAGQGTRLKHHLSRSSSLSSICAVASPHQTEFTEFPKPSRKHERTKSRVIDPSVLSHGLPDQLDSPRRTPSNSSLNSLGRPRSVSPTKPRMARTPSSLGRVPEEGSTVNKSICRSSSQDFNPFRNSRTPI